jgi:hypothetical protein
MAAATALEFWFDSDGNTTGVGQETGCAGQKELVEFRTWEQIANDY